MEAHELTLVAIATLAGATVQSATGFGFALVASPAVFAVAEPAEAITIVIALSSALNLLVMFAERRPLKVRSGQSLRLLLWAAPGVVAGVFILIALSKPTLQVIVGAIVIVAVAAQLRSPEQSNRATPRSLEAAAGLAAGTLTTTTATSGPPLVLLLRSEGATPGEFRDTMAALLLCLNFAGALALVLAGGRAELPGAAIVLILVAVVGLGRFLGRLIFNRLDHDSFRAAGSVVIVAAGLASIVAGVAG